VQGAGFRVRGAGRERGEKRERDLGLKRSSNAIFLHAHSPAIRASGSGCVPDLKIGFKVSFRARFEAFSYFFHFSDCSQA
jgi:hypothetical protein